MKINNFDISTLGSAIVYFRHGFFFIALVALLNTDQKFIRYFFYSILICFLILILDGFYQYFNGKNIIGLETPDKNRVSSFFHEEMILGSYLSRLWPIFFGLSIFIIKQKKMATYLCILIIILSYVLIFLSGDRAAFFNVNLSLIIILLFTKKYFKFKLITFLSSFFLIFIITFINPTAKQRVFDQTINQLTADYDENRTLYIFSKDHTHHYITAYRMFLDQKIFGVGMKNFRYLCNEKKYESNKDSCATHPHNTYIQVLAELGLVGLLFLLILFFYYIKSLFKHMLLKFKGKNYFSDFEICCLSGIAIYLWPFIPTGNFFTNWLSILMFLNIAVFLYAKNIRKF